MNNLIRLAPSGPDAPFVQTLSDRPFGWLPDLLMFLRRRWKVAATTLACVLVLAVGYLLYATPKFTATAALLVDTQAAATLQNQPTINDSQYINGLVESQVEVVQSDGVARAVVQKLKLASDPAFLANGHGLLSTVIGYVAGLFAPDTPYDAGQQDTLAAQLLEKMIDVKRLGESYVLNVSVTARDAGMAARLANAVATAYADAGLGAKSQATRRASTWMDDRARQLREQAVSADEKVQAYKAAHNIVDTDKGLLDQHELGELSKQLILAHANTAQAEARYEQIQSIMKNGVYDGNVMDALQDEVITKLREEYVTDQRMHNLWASHYGANNGSVQNLTQQMATIQRSIQSELSRIAQGYRSAYQAAEAGETAMQQKLTQLTQDANGINQQMVTLRSLQSQAETYRSLYASFLQRYTQALQDESFPVAQSEVITTAEAPVKKSWPKPPLILAAAGVLGLGLGFTLAIVRDTLDRGVRTGAQLRAALGLDCLGLMPLISSAGRKRLHRRRDIARHAAARSLASWPALLRLAGTDPMSQVADVMRRTRVRISQLGTEKQGGKVIGCVSARSGEGKSTISANLASCMARAGLRTLLIDWDLRKHTLSTALAAGQPAGFVDLVAGPEATVTNVLWHDPVSQLRFLPGGSGSGSTLPCAVEALNVPSAQALIDALRQHYDCIVVDLPAMEAAADADAAASMTDALLLVVEWGRTDIETLVECLAGTQAIAPRLMGAVLNKVDLRALRRYSDYGVSTRPVPYSSSAAPA
ncbi:MAG TPA: Wzz/FepE/Etk N-terminal domain-containing protein [Acetobacteraceae bacterium]|jgi:succinoglycan biosynthesis transport protein ExoP|nr:Wzz/FepE/Etk N-terminal domain-containing protein [Acetobacteraceae bacterium]